VCGLGEWLPPTVRLNTEWPAEFVGRPVGLYTRELAEIATGEGDCATLVASFLASEEGDPFSGARARRVAIDSMSSAAAEAAAGACALADAGVDARDVDMVLSWSMVPDRITPPAAPRVAHILGATRAGAIGIDVACASVIAQIAFATALIEAGRAHVILITQSHLISRANPLMHPASPIVGDAATAVVIGAQQTGGVGTIHMISHGEHHETVTWARGREDAEEVPWWKAGGHFFPGTRDRIAAEYLSGQLVPYARATILELLAKAGQPVECLSVLAMTQPRRWFPRAVAISLGLAGSLAPDTFDELGHVGGCGVITNLIEARRRGMLHEGGRVVLYAMGAGITRSAALIHW
jgi:3-oxoacyl-[acyl-carrier-protein] synthase-3